MNQPIKLLCLTGNLKKGGAEKRIKALSEYLNDDKILIFITDSWVFGFCICFIGIGSANFVNYGVGGGISVLNKLPFIGKIVDTHFIYNYLKLGLKNLFIFILSIPVTIFNYTILIFALITTVGLQVLSNFANDYGDGVKGTDNLERVGPMRAIQSGIISDKEISIFNNNNSVLKNSKFSEVVIYNFETNTFSKKFNQQIQNENFKTYSQGIAEILKDGSMLISDDYGDAIYRVSYNETALANN